MRLNDPILFKNSRKKSCKRLHLGNHRNTKRVQVYPKPCFLESISWRTIHPSAEFKPLNTV